MRTAPLPTWLAALAALAAVAAVVAPAPALADPTPLSSLPEKPARYARADGKIPVSSASDHRHRIHVTAEPPVCLISEPPRYWIDGEAAVDDRHASLVLEGGDALGVERLVIRGDAAELERVAATAAGDGVLDPTARSRIPLHAVAQLDGLVVYAYRWASQVHLVARSGVAPVVRSDEGVLTETTECGIAYALLRVRNGSSQVAQIRGTVPRTGRRYLVDASVSQTGRDPEPLLSVTARLLDR